MSFGHLRSGRRGTVALAPAAENAPSRGSLNAPKQRPRGVRHIGDSRRERHESRGSSWARRGPQAMPWQSVIVWKTLLLPCDLQLASAESHRVPLTRRKITAAWMLPAYRLY
jgi:hypothetical protein